MGGTEAVSTDWRYQMDEQGETPLSRAFKSGHVALADLVIKHEEASRPSKVAELPPLQRAAYWGLENAVRRMLDNGADPSERDGQGETPLHKAVRQGHSLTVKLLLEHGADADSPDDLGMTTLHWAALSGHQDVAELLLEKGARANVRDGYAGGLTPLSIAKLMGYEELAETIGRYGGTW
ncbi:MAG: ankyrin repeat domain-containing protein [Candidatus Hydrogenedentes bacterium]|nr:ankyrin repeat domain-containing protein [Candidatus Hydrogenedentota bacterium]